MIELVAFDLDGTLIGRDLELTQRVRDSIARMQHAGIAGCIVTGRMYRAALPFARELHFDAPVICYQGAAIVDPVTDDVLKHTALENEAVLALIDYAEASHVHLQLYRNDEYYCEERNRFSELYASLAKAEPVVVESLRQTFAYSAATKAIVIADAPDAARYEKEVTNLLGARAYVTRSLPEFVEVIDPHTDKGEALRFVAQRMKVPMDHVAAIGDSWNDRPLLEAAALRIAMGSAPPELREIAHAVVGDAASDGVAEAIEKYVLV